MSNSLLNVVIPLIVVAVVLAIYILWVRSCDFTCGNCRAAISLPVLQVLFAPKWLRMRQVRCPVCGQRNWAAPVAKGK